MSAAIVAAYSAAAPERVTVDRRANDGEPGAGLWEWFGPNSDRVYTDDGGTYFATELEAWKSAYDANGWLHPSAASVLSIASGGPDYLYTPERCPSKHWNDGNDICADCGTVLS